MPEDRNRCPNCDSERTRDYVVGLALVAAGFVFCVLTVLLVTIGSNHTAAAVTFVLFLVCAVTGRHAMTYSQCDFCGAVWRRE